MHHLRLLLNKELLLWRNTHLRTRKQAVSLLITVVVVVSLVGLLTRLLTGWLQPLMSELPPSQQGAVAGALSLVIFVWLAVLVFLQAFQESKDHFLLNPEIQLLMATPVSASSVIAIRFLSFTCFNRTRLLLLSFLCFAPMIALGLAAGAPWYFYVLLLPLTIMLLMAPAALAIILLILLARRFSPSRFLQVTSFLQFVAMGLAISYMVSQRHDLLSAAQHLQTVISPFGAIGDMWAGLMGLGTSVSPGIAAVLLAAVISMAAVALSMKRIYYQSYERMQIAEQRRPAKGKEYRFSAPSRTGRLGFLISHQWRLAIRNREMLQGTFGFIMIPILYVIVAAVYVPERFPSMMLINSAVAAIFVPLAVFAPFHPPSMKMSDYSAPLQRHYGPLKSAPVEERLVSLSMTLSTAIPSILVGIPVLLAANHFTGVSPDQMAMSLVILVLVLGSTATVFQLSMITDAGSVGQAVPLLTRIVREVVPYAYPAVALIPLAIGIHYLDLPFLSFMHGLPSGWVLTAAIALTVILTAAVARISIGRMSSAWARLEIK